VEKRSNTIEKEISKHKHDILHSGDQKENPGILSKIKNLLTSKLGLGLLLAGAAGANYYWNKKPSPTIGGPPATINTIERVAPRKTGKKEFSLRKDWKENDKINVALEEKADRKWANENGVSDRWNEEAVSSDPLIHKYTTPKQRYYLKNLLMVGAGAASSALGFGSFGTLAGAAVADTLSDYVFNSRISA